MANEDVTPAPEGASAPNEAAPETHEAIAAEQVDQAEGAGVPNPDAQFDHSQPLGERKHYFDYPENVDKVLRFFFIGCGLLLVIDVLVKFFHVPFHHHATFPEDATFAEGSFETWPFFYAFYGFAACVLLVLAATQLRKVLMRREDYYDVR